MLGAEPVIDGDDLGLRAPADLRGQAGGEEGVPHGVHPAVEVQDHVTRFDSVHHDLRGRDAAENGCGHGHIGGQRLRRCQLPEQPPLLADVEVGGDGGLPQDRVEGLSLLGGHGDLPSVGIRLAAPGAGSPVVMPGASGPGQRPRAAIGPGAAASGVNRSAGPSVEP